MFGEMRRKKQALPLEACEKILERGTSGVLALEGEEGYPYAVPLSYYYEKGKIFFHCGKRGYKIEALKRNEKVSFCVIDQDQIIPEEYTTYFRSVIVFGKICILEGEAEKRRAIEKLALHLAPHLLHCHTSHQVHIGNIPHLPELPTNTIRKPSHNFSSRRNRNNNEPRLHFEHQYPPAQQQAYNIEKLFSYSS